MGNPVNVDMRSLEERQALVRAEIMKLPDGHRIVETLERTASHDSLKVTVMAMVMGRDLWERYWRVYTETVERETSALLDRCEAEKAKPKSIF